MCCCAYYFYAICVLLACDVYLGWFTSTWRSGNLDLHINPGQDKPTQAKLTAWEACKASLVNVSNRRYLISLLWDRDQDETLRSSTIDAIAAQVCCIGQLSGNIYMINKIAHNTCKTLTQFIFLQVKNKPSSPWEQCVYSWEQCWRKQLEHSNFP
jgi:hypothetical protein